MIRLKFEPRLYTPKWVNVVVPIAAVIAGLTAGALLFVCLGVDPVKAYSEVIKGALGSGYGLSEIVVKATPITLTALGGLVCYRMGLWNIGAEGQLCLGAIATAGVVRYLFIDNSVVMFFLMLTAAAAAGGLWCMAAGFLKERWNVNETIVTLMLNYVAINLSEYFIYGPWKDPMSMGFPFTVTFPEAARFWTFFNTRIHGGLFIALGAAVLLHIVLKYSKWGYEIAVTGQNPRGAR